MARRPVLQESVDLPFRFAFAQLSGLLLTRMLNRRTRQPVLTKTNTGARGRQVALSATVGVAQRMFRAAAS
jgi:hypothetical protein